MTGSSSIMIDLDDPRSEKIAEVISNKTAKKILISLAEGEKSIGDISLELGLPVNTVSYNIDKMVGAGIIEKAKKYLWSVKGRKIEYYKVSNRRIIIEPKKMIRGIVPVLLITLVFAFLIGNFYVMSENGVNKFAMTREKIAASALGFEGTQGSEPMTLNAEENYGEVIYNSGIDSIDSWAWFLIGAWFSLLVFILWNWRKN
ncbi:MAG: winged helix-turn-helix domain-containing protein [Nanoarchaeota archaeon]